MSRLRIQRMPSGSRPLAGSSRITVAGSPSSAAATPEALTHAQREATDTLTGDVAQSDDLDHLLDASAGMPCVWASASRWL